jgi:hypothetical protein
MDAAATRPENSNRAHRRRLRAFGRGRVLTTDLIVAPISVQAHPKGKRIASAIRGCIASNPNCICCHNRPIIAGAFLTGWTAASNDIAVACICTGCWASATDAEIEHAATIALQDAVPGGRFLD